MSNLYKPLTASYYTKKDGKVAIVTGGNQGIGFYTVLELYMHGFTVYLFGRNETKCLKAIEDIKQESSTRRENYTETELTFKPVGDIKYIKCDLTHLSSVEDAFKQFSKQENHLDVLINNAGIMAQPYEVTEDDYEIQYQVNVVGHMLLTLKLLPYLSKSKEPRIVQVSSFAHYFSVNYLRPEQNLNKFPDALYTFLRYARAKLAAIHFIKMLAKKYPNILCIAVHPGIINSSLYDAGFASYSFLGPIMRSVFFKSMSFIALTTEQGSLASLRAAMDETLTIDNNGCYIRDGGVDGKESTIASNSEYIQHTWDWNIEQLASRGYKFDIN